MAGGQGSLTPPVVGFGLRFAGREMRYYVFVAKTEWRRLLFVFPKQGNRVATCIEDSPEDTKSP